MVGFFFNLDVFDNFCVSNVSLDIYVENYFFLVGEKERICDLIGPIVSRERAQQVQVIIEVICALEARPLNF